MTLRHYDALRHTVVGGQCPSDVSFVSSHRLYNKKRGFRRVGVLLCSVRGAPGKRLAEGDPRVHGVRDRLSPLNERQKKKVESISESEDPISGRRLDESGQCTT
jgi:hypothetical protein